MSLKITRKPVLHEVIPEVLLPEVQTVPTVQVDNFSSVVEDVINDYTTEIAEWDSLLQQANLELFSTSIPVASSLIDELNIEQFTISDLQNWLNTGNTLWADMSISFEEKHWDSGTSVLGMLYGSILEVKQELETSLASIANSVITPSVLPKQVSEVHNTQIKQAKDLRNKISNAIKHAEKKLPECYVRKLARTFQKTVDKNSSLSTSVVGFSTSKSEFINTIRAAKLILRYSMINSKVNWKTTRKNVLNRFLQVFAMKVMGEATSKLGELYNKTNEPVTQFVSHIIELINEPGCDAFDELTSILINETKALRLDYISKLYEWEKDITNKFALRGSLVDVVNRNVTMNKHLATLDIILSSVDTLLSSGRLEEDIVKYVKGKIKVN